MRQVDGNMLNGSDAGRYQIGQVVQLVEGPFAGFTGTIEAINETKRRLRITIPIYGRQTPMEFAFDEVRKL